MALLADRISNIKESATLKITAKAQELKAEGKDIIGLGAGEPDFDTPDYIKDAAKAAMDAGQTKYTPVPGTPQLRQAVADKLRNENELTYQANQVIIGTGGKQVLFNALYASLNAGDEVIIPAPYWVSYPDMTLLCEGVPVIVECLEENSFKLSPEQLEAAITPRTKWIILNSPSNPTGEAYTKQEMEALAAVIRKHSHVHVMADDIYEHLVYSGAEFHTFAQAAPDLIDRTLTVNGVSKAFSMTGWRIGYGAGPLELIKAMTKIQSQSTSNASSISQAAALAALTGDTSFLADWRQSFEARRNLVVKMINSCPGLSCRTPSGAFYVYVNAEKLMGTITPSGKPIESDVDLAAYLLEHALVAVVPGSAFGLAPYFRISYAVAEETLESACARICEATAKLQKSLPQAG